jgi:ribosome biogenesis protein NSA2
MPQGDYIDLHRKRHGYRYDFHERTRKREARLAKKRAEFAQKVTGLRAKLYNKKRFAEKVELKKTLRMHEEKTKTVDEADNAVAGGALPHYLLDRKEVSRAKVLSNTVKQKRKEKAGKWSVPLPKVRPISDEEMFRSSRPASASRSSGSDASPRSRSCRRPLRASRRKFERFIRPTGLRMKKANVTHPELKSTFQLDILGVKKNPSSQLYTQLGVITKGTIIEVNVSELGLVTSTGKILWSKYCQVTNNPENDGCINAVLLV